MQKNYFKIGLYAVGTIAVLVAVYMIFRAVLRAKQGINTLGDTIQDTRVNNEIAQETGLTVHEVDQARKIAKDLAVELELYKGMSWADKSLHIVTDSEIMEIASAIKSAPQMRAVAAIFRNEMTHNKSLYEMLKNELSSANLRSVPFIESITI